MKKLFALLLTGAMAFGMMACGNNDNEEPVAEQKEITADMEAMAAPIDALARCMLENNLEYDPEDPEFFWTALYYFTGAYGFDHNLVTMEEGSYQLKIPTPVMQEHATVLFAAYDDLFDLPSIMKGNVSYDPDWDAYFVSMGDIGMSEMKLISYAETMNGYEVKAELWSTGPDAELIRAYDVTMIDSAYIDGIENPMYLYSISDIVMHEAPESSGTDASGVRIETTAIFNGLADSHTVELTLPDGTVQAFQFEEYTDPAATFVSLQEGDGVFITYVETETGALKILTAE